MNMSGNTIFIAGATSGIGLGLALRLNAAGNTVIIGGRDRERLAAITAEHPDLATVEIDVKDPESIQAAAAEVISRFPALNVLIPMAGIMLPEDLRSTAFLATAEDTVTTNLLGPIRLIAAFTELLITRPEAAIITVSSGLAFVPLPITPTYNATKAAIHSLSMSLRIQLATTGVQVIELIPPGVRTTLMGQQDSEQAMPLDSFLDETMALLAEDPEAEEILVEPVKLLRFAESNGSHQQVLAMLSDS